MTLKTSGQYSESKAFDAFLKTTLSDAIETVDVSSVNIDSIILLDTRSKEEFEVSHLKNAIWVGYDNFNLKRVKNLSKNAKIVVYCSVGVRSGKVGKKLLDADFKNVKNLYGGIFEWYNRGLPVYNEKGETDDLHTYNFIWSLWVNKRN